MHDNCRSRLSAGQGFLAITLPSNFQRARDNRGADRKYGSHTHAHHAGHGRECPGHIQVDAVALHGAEGKRGLSHRGGTHRLDSHGVYHSYSLLRTSVEHNIVLPNRF